MPLKQEKIPHWVRATQTRLKRHQARLPAQQASVEHHRLALENPDLTIAERMHHMQSLRFRERDVRTTLGRIALLERSTTYEDYLAYPSLEEEVRREIPETEQVFRETYAWAAEQYAAKGDNGNAARMRKQVEHWSK